MIDDKRGFYMKRISKGASLAQYAIVLAIVAGFCAMIYIQYGESIKTHLKNILNMQSSINDQMAQNKAINQKSVSLPTAGSLGGLEKSPVKECNNGSCTVDFGDYILSGIPENFSEYVEANGNSGGTDKLADLAGMLAQQLNEEGLPSEAGLLQQFSDLLAFMGQIQGTVENKANACMLNADPNCLKNSIDGIKMSLPNNLQSVLTDYDSSCSLINVVQNPLMPTDTMFEHETSLLDGISGSITDIDRNIPQSDPAIYDRLPSKALAETYFQILDDPDIPDPVKDMVKSITSSEAFVAADCTGKVSAMTTDIPTEMNLDPTDYELTDVLSKNKNFSGSTLQDLVNPQHPVELKIPR